MKKIVLYGNDAFLILQFQSDVPPFPTIKSKHSLVAKHVTPEKWKRLGGLHTKTSGFTLGQVYGIYTNIN